MGDPPWAVRIVYNEVFGGVLICQNTLAGPHIYKEAMAQYKKLESGFDSLLSCVEVKDYLIKD